jgi:hypothetical protein
LKNNKERLFHVRIGSAKASTSRGAAEMMKYIHRRSVLRVKELWEWVVVVCIGKYNKTEERTTKITYALAEISYNGSWWLVI